MRILIALLLVVSTAFADTATYQMTERTRASVIVTEYGPGMISFTGTLVPDISGVRFVDRLSNHEDKAVYIATVGDDDWFVWWDGTDTWKVSQEIGETDPSWTRTNASVIGAFTAGTNVTGTATAASDGFLKYENSSPYPWTPASLEVVQGAGITNNVTMTVYRVFDYAAPIRGASTVTNAFGETETVIDTSPASESWRQFSNEVFSVAQDATNKVYSVNTDPILASDVYIDTDDVIVIKYDSLTGVYFRINGVK